jgi:uncharacterized protein YbjT (DUF2867 family)
MGLFLISGPTGNIGMEVLQSLYELKIESKIIAGTHNIASAQKKLTGYPSLEYRKLDFADPSTFEEALSGVDIVFLLRPPQLADIEKYFEPFLQAMKRQMVENIIFLSVQGVENQHRIPHYKLERLIERHGLHYVFLRPGYFMQNLTTTLWHDIKYSGQIYIPAGKLKFNWVDARDIGRVTAHIFSDFEQYSNKALEITGNEMITFKEVAEILSKVLGKNIKYVSPNLVSFYIKKKKQGMPRNMIFVMIMLHYLPRFQNQNIKITHEVKSITGQQPGRLKDFIIREKEKFM